MFLSRLVRVFGLAVAGAILVWLASRSDHPSHKKRYWIAAAACFAGWIIVLAFLSSIDF